MSIVRCPNCNNYISSGSKVCIHCGYTLKKNKKRIKILKHNKKFVPKIIILIAVCLFTTVIGVCFFRIYQNSNVEGIAKKCAEELKDIKNEDINIETCVCRSQPSWDDNNGDGYCYQYLFGFSFNGEAELSEFQFNLNDGKIQYLGNGEDGGDKTDERGKSLNNAQVKEFQKTFAKYMIDAESVKTITKEELKNHEHGLYPIDVSNFK